MVVKSKKRKKNLFRITFDTASGFVTKYSNSLKTNSFYQDGIRRASKGVSSGTVSRLNKKTNRFRKEKKIGW